MFKGIVYECFVQKLSTLDVSLAIPYQSYGIRAVFHTSKRKLILKEIPDIYFNPKAVAHLAELMNHHQLSLVHFGDVVEDFCSNDYRI